MAERQELNPADLAEQVWVEILWVRTRDDMERGIRNIAALLQGQSNATAARALDRLTVASKQHPLDEKHRRTFQYTKNTHGLLWDVYKLVSGDAGVDMGNFDEMEPSHWTRRLMEYYQRLHNIQTFKRLNGIESDQEAAFQYDVVVASNLTKDGKKSNLKLSVAKASVKTTSALHWDLFKGRADVVFFMPASYLRASWKYVTINGAGRKIRDKLVGFFEFPTVLCQFFHHSAATLQTLRLSNLRDVRYFCDGNIMTSYVQGDDAEGIVDLKYATLGMAFPKMSYFMLSGLFDLRSLAWKDVAMRRLKTVILEGLSNCPGQWDPATKSWMGLGFSVDFRELHTLTITGGQVPLLFVDCRKLKKLAFGSTTRTAPLGFPHYLGPSAFPIISQETPLEELILKDGYFKSIFAFHYMKDKSNWRPKFPKLVRLELINIDIHKSKTVREFSRMSYGDQGPRVLVWNNVRVVSYIMGGADFQEGESNPYVYKNPSVEETETILRRMINCNNLTIINDESAFKLQEVLKNNRVLQTLHIEDVPNAFLVMPEHTANGVISLTRPNLRFDDHAETILARRGNWIAGGKWAVAAQQVNPAPPPSGSPMNISVDSPGTGVDDEETKDMVLRELQRIGQCTGPIDYDARGNPTPAWMDVGDNVQQATQLLFWEETILRWMTRSIASDDLLLPHWEGLSMDFTFEAPSPTAEGGMAVRAMSRHVGANMFQTVMQYDDAERTLFHEIQFLPDDDVRQGYLTKFQDEVARREEEAMAAEEAMEQAQGMSKELEKGKEEEALRDPSEEAEEAIKVNRPAFLAALQSGTVGIQFRIRAGPRHEGWAFVSADPSQNTEEIGVGATTLTFDHTFTFTPFNGVRGYVMRPAGRGVFDVFYRDVTLGMWRKDGSGPRSGANAEDKVPTFEMGTLTISPEGTHRYYVDCQTIMTIIGVRCFQSMAFVSDHVLLQEDAFRRELKREGVYVGAALEEQLAKYMAMVSSPVELGAPLWIKEGEGTSFRVVANDVESTTLYLEVIDAIRMMMLAGMGQQDAPFSQFRAHASNYLMFVYFAGRAMGSALRGMRKAQGQISTNVFDRFQSIYQETWIPMMRWTTSQEPVILSFNMERAMDLFFNLVGIAELAKTKRKRRPPTVAGQDAEARADVLEQWKLQVFDLYGKLVTGIQIFMSPHMYELMYDDHGETYATLDEQFLQILQTYVVMDTGRQEDSQTKSGFRAVTASTAQKELDTKIAALFEMIQAFFDQVQEEVDDDAFDLMESPGQGKDEDEDEEEEEVSPVSPFNIPGLTFSTTTGSSGEVEIDTSIFDSPIDRAIMATLEHEVALSNARTEEERRVVDAAYVEDVGERVRHNAMLIAAETPAQFTTPVKSRRRAPPKEPHTAPMAEIAAAKRRTSVSPESLRSLKPSPPELVVRTVTSSGGVLQSDSKIDAMRRARLLRFEMGARETNQTQIPRPAPNVATPLRTKSGAPQKNIGLQNPRPLVVDLTTSPSPPRSTVKRLKMASPKSPSTRERRQQEETQRKREAQRKQEEDSTQLYDDQPPPGGGAFSFTVESKISRRCASIGCREKATNRCAKCKSVYYCGRKCQVKHYSEHRRECKLKQ